MGTGNIQGINVATRTVVYRQHHNSLADALLGDFVPRNASGIATNLFGDLGTSTYRWNEAHIHDLIVYNSATFPTRRVTQAISAESGDKDITIGYDPGEVASVVFEQTSDGAMWNLPFERKSGTEITVDLGDDVLTGTARVFRG